MTQKDIDFLNKQTHEVLAEWWCMLNSYKCPLKLGKYKHEIEVSKTGIGWEIMCHIDSIVPNRLISRIWNKDMSDEEFNDFYDGTYEGDVDAKARYEKWLTEKCIIRGEK